MARKAKDQIVAFEVMSPDPMHPHTERVCRNFVCFKNSLKDNLVNEIRKEELRKDEKTLREFDVICGYQTEARDGLGNLGMDMVSITPAVLEKSVKVSTPYIYRTLDYSLNKPVETFGTKKDALSFIQKRIKTKNAIMHYNGVTEKCEFNVERLSSLFDTLEADTVEFDIATLGRNTEGDIILVTIFKNCLK